MVPGFRSLSHRLQSSIERWNLNWLLVYIVATTKINAKHSECLGIVHMPRVISTFHDISSPRTTRAIYQIHHRIGEMGRNSLRIFNLISILCTWNSAFEHPHPPPLISSSSFLHRRQIDFCNKSRMQHRHWFIGRTNCVQFDAQTGMGLAKCVWLFWNANHGTHANSRHSSANASVSIWSIRVFRLFKKYFVVSRQRFCIESKSLIKLKWKPRCLNFLLFITLRTSVLFFALSLFRSFPPFASL